MNIKAKDVRFKKNLNNHGFLFHHNIISYYLLGIGYEYVRRIPCICSACLRKLTPHGIEVNIGPIKIYINMQIKTMFIVLL